jgi:hypothetical protein
MCRMSASMLQCRGSEQLEAAESSTLAVVGFSVVRIAIIPLVRDRNYRFKGTGNG